MPGGDISAPSPRTILVDIRDNFFQPDTVTVTRGGHVRWTNRGHKLHSVIGHAAVLRSGLMPPRTWFEARFDDPGTFDFQCSLHEEMTGTVIVR